ncbi:hypothetical protein IV203_015562 [Nitzschia inconspicua]|uniref:Uncharacterized protein n=1 Tax=Nitzschia inconspicua TaxID=303405 RepID=A0A9K3LBH6_9STRA|nr:hypothetical protein IV203_015562 [Nitzschia inconspicua]
MGTTLNLFLIAETKVGFRHTNEKPVFAYSVAGNRSLLPQTIQGFPFILRRNANFVQGISVLSTKTALAQGQGRAFTGCGLTHLIVLQPQIIQKHNMTFKRLQFFCF